MQKGCITGSCMDSIHSEQKAHTVSVFPPQSESAYCSQLRSLHSSSYCTVACCLGIHTIFCKRANPLRSPEYRPADENELETERHAIIWTFDGPTAAPHRPSRYPV
jgi:hypothetical protein